MFDIRASTDDRHGEQDERKVAKYRDQLLEAFAASTEGVSLGGSVGGWLDLMLEYAFQHIGVTIPAMTAGDFQEILFDLFPRKVSTPAESAGPIVSELRAFWQFVHRQYGLPNATEILAVLDDRAERRLFEKLSNSANYGMAKSIFMQGEAAGFDMTTSEGLDAFQAAYNAQLGGPIVQFEEDDFADLPLVGPSLTPEKLRQVKDKKKQARKAQRKARKRNR